MIWIVCFMKQPPSTAAAPRSLVLVRVIWRFGDELRWKKSQNRNDRLGDPRVLESRLGRQFRGLFILAARVVLRQFAAYFSAVWRYRETGLRPGRMRRQRGPSLAACNTLASRKAANPCSHGIPALHTRSRNACALPLLRLRYLCDKHLSPPTLPHRWLPAGRPENHGRRGRQEGPSNRGCGGRARRRRERSGGGRRRSIRRRHRRETRRRRACGRSASTM